MDVDSSALIDQGIAAGVDYVTSSPDVKRITGAMSSGAAFGATIGTVFPGIGTVVGGAIGAIAGAVSALVPVIAGAFRGQCTITIKGLDTACRDYPRNVAVAAKWIKDNATAALHLSPEAFSAQAHVLVQDFAEWFGTTAPNYQARIRDSGAHPQLMKLPGARTLLRVAQLPAAGALAVVMPLQPTMQRLVLPRMFPALTGMDLDTILGKVSARHGQAMTEATAWAIRLPQQATPDLIRQRFPILSPADAQVIAGLPRVPAPPKLTPHPEVAARPGGSPAHDVHFVIPIRVPTGPAPLTPSPPNDGERPTPASNRSGGSALLALGVVSVGLLLVAGTSRATSRRPDAEARSGSKRHTERVS